MAKRYIALLMVLHLGVCVAGDSKQGIGEHDAGRKGAATERRTEQSGQGASGDESGSTIPYRTDQVAPKGLLLKVVFVTGAIIALLVAAAYIMKLYLYGNNRRIAEKRHINIIETKRLSPKVTVFLVSIERQRYLITQSGESIDVRDCSASHEGDSQGEPVGN